MMDNFNSTKLNTTCCTVHNLELVSVASGMDRYQYCHLDPMNPTLAPLLLYLNLTPLSKLSSRTVITNCKNWVCNFNYCSLLLIGPPVTVKLPLMVTVGQLYHLIINYYSYDKLLPRINVVGNPIVIVSPEQCFNFVCRTKDCHCIAAIVIGAVYFRCPLLMRACDTSSTCRCYTSFCIYS